MFRGAAASARRGRRAWWHERWTGPKPVIFGHHVVDEPLICWGLVYGIDTGACHGNRLTALALPDFRIYSVPAREDHWSRIKRAYQADVLASKPWSTMLWPELDEQLARSERSTIANTRCLPNLRRLGIQLIVADEPVCADEFRWLLDSPLGQQLTTFGLDYGLLPLTNSIDEQSFAAYRSERGGTFDYDFNSRSGAAR